MTETFISSISDFLLIISKIRAENKPMPSTELMFRGESRIRKTNCLSSLGRLLFDKNSKYFGDENFNINLEKNFLDAWRIKAENSDNYFYPENEWELLMWARHHGLKCRLTDWTTNPLVALYFACQDSFSSDGILFTCESPVFETIAMDSPPFISNDSEYKINSLYTIPMIGKARHIFIKPPRTFHKRIVMQSGVFHSSSSIKESAVGLSSQLPFNKMRIKASQKGAILLELKYLNITKETLGLMTPDEAANELNESFK